MVTVKDFERSIKYRLMLKGFSETILRRLNEYNPAHDASGRFGTTSGAGAMSSEHAAAVEDAVEQATEEGVEDYEREEMRDSMLEEAGYEDEVGDLGEMAFRWSQESGEGMSESQKVRISREDDYYK